jgi:hypothetical protein
VDNVCHSLPAKFYLTSHKTLAGDHTSNFSTLLGGLMSKLKFARLTESYWQFLIIGVVALLVEFLFRGRRGGQMFFGGPDIYWSIHWARDYSAGFDRRALLGGILRIFYLDPTDYLIITTFAWISSLALYFAVIAATWKLVLNLHTLIRMSLLVTVILSPATTGLIVETTGDPLQLLLAVYFLLIWFFFRTKPSPAIAMALFATFGIASVMVHEANVFFTVPCTFILAAWKRTTAAYVALLSHMVASALAVAFVVFAGESLTASSAIIAIHLGGKSITGSFSSFHDLFAEEMKRLFGSGARGYFRWIIILLSSLLLPVFFIYLLMLFYSPRCEAVAQNGRARIVFLLSNYLGRSTARNPCLGTIFFTMVVLSVPLYLIALDWARFLSYSFFCTIVLFALAGEREVTNSSAAGSWPMIGVGLVLAGLTVSPFLDGYRYLGLFANMNIFMTTLLMIAVALIMDKLLVHAPKK